MLSKRRNAQVTVVQKLKIINFQHDKDWYLNHAWSDKAFKGTVVNQTMQSLNREGQITLTGLQLYKLLIACIGIVIWHLFIKNLGCRFTEIFIKKCEIFYRLNNNGFWYRIVYSCVYNLSEPASSKHHPSDRNTNKKYK